MEARQLSPDAEEVRCRLGSCQLMQRSEMQARGLSADAEKVDWRLDRCQLMQSR